MNFLLETLRLGLNNLRLHKLRSVLTSLGIILGVAAVIVVVAIGEGNKRSALRDIEALGATNIIVRSTKPAASGSAAAVQSFLVSYGIRRVDLRRLEAGLPDAKRVVPLKSVGSEIRRGASRTTSSAFGTVPALLEAANLRVRPRGRYLSEEDLASSAPVAVIGSAIAEQFFPLEDPIGADFRIDNEVFRVVGVLEPIGFAGGAGSALVGRDLNRDIHIPLSTAQLRFGDVVVRRESGSFSGEEVELYEIYISAPDTGSVLGMADRISSIMAVGHPGFEGVQMIVPWELLENAKKALVVWNIMLVAIAAISLIVGGIGIMNIMLASITERTREIGIRRALGATRRHIVSQFLVETGTLSTVGGMVGIAFGVSVAMALERVVPLLLRLPAFAALAEGRFTLEPRITAWSIVASFAVAAGVGLVFGIYPAIVASRKDPIEALRHD
jgi:putative ABC transport system permease protein